MSAKKRVKLRRARNHHVHIRKPKAREIGGRVMRYHALWCSRITCICNTPAVRSASELAEYYTDVRQIIAKQKLNLEIGLVPMIDSGFTTAAVVGELCELPEFDGLKFMFRGTSTSSIAAGSKRLVGVDPNDVHGIYPGLAVLQERSKPLLLHHELPPGRNYDDRMREVGCTSVYQMIRRDFPRLPISVEHITTREVLQCVRTDFDRYEGLTVGGVTPQGMGLTWSDVLTNSLNVHNLCRPPAKIGDDCDALCKAVFEEEAPYLACDTDCAPHEHKAKNSDNVPCGIFNSPVALQVYAGLCEQWGGNWQALEAFLTRAWPWESQPHGDEGFVTLVKRPWNVPAKYSGIVPLNANQRLTWSLLEA